MGGVRGGRRRQRSAALAAVVLSGAVVAVAGAEPAAGQTVVVVDTGTDVVDGGDGLTSLREAVDQANAGPTSLTIRIAASVPTVTLSMCPAPAGSDDDTNVAGDLDLLGTNTTSVTVEGGGATIVQNCPQLGVIQATSVALTLDDVTLTGPGTSNRAGAVRSNTDLAVDTLTLDGWRGEGLTSTAGLLTVRAADLDDLSDTAVVGFDVSVSGSTVVNSVAGIQALSTLVMTGSTVSGHDQAGVRFQADSSIVGGRIADNGGPGVRAQGSARVDLDGVTIEGNGGSGVVAGGDVTAVDTVASDNGENGIITTAAVQATRVTANDNDSTGIVANGGLNGSVVTAERNGVRGLDVSTRSSLVGATVRFNSADGITFFTPSDVLPSTIAGSDISDNGGSGIFTQGPLDVATTTIASNALQGISSQHRVTGNDLAVRQNDTGVVARRGVELVRATIEQNDADGLNLGNASSATNSTITDSSVSANGGAGVRSALGSITVDGTTVSNNTTDGIGADGTATLVDSTVSGNGDRGIFAEDRLEVRSSDVTSNTSSGVVGLGVVEVTGSTVSRNQERGVDATGLTLVTTSEIRANGSSGIVIFTDAATGRSEVIDTVLADNGEHGVFAQGHLDLVDVTVDDNAENGVFGLAGVTVTGSTLQDNQRGVFGPGDILIDRSTITGNSTDGVHLYQFDDPTPTAVIRNSAVTANTVGVFASTGQVDIEFSGVVRNLTVDLDVVVASEAVASAIGTCARAVGTDRGHNASTETSCGFDAPTSQQSLTDIGFRPGPALLTSDSGPLYDAIPPSDCRLLDGTPLTVDIDGATRPLGQGCEIGPDEVPPPGTSGGGDPIGFTAVAVDVARGGSVDVDPAATMSDPDGVADLSTLRIVAAPRLGTATVVGGQVRYTAGFTSGDDTFRFEVCAAGGRRCGTGTVTVAVAPVAPGYWVAEADGDVFGFGAVPDLPSVQADLQPGETAVDMAPHPDGAGYWVLTSTGRLLPRGSATDLGAVDLDAVTDPPRKPGEDLTSVVASATGDGAWVFTDQGRILALGDATPASAMTNGDLVVSLDLDGDIVATFPSPSGQGVYMAGADGGVFAVGDATFVNSVRDFLPPGVSLDQPIVGMVADPDGLGYWLVAADGGVFAIEAPFVGSLPALVPFDQLAAPINGMVAAGDGYFLVADDGGVFAFQAPFLGSAAGRTDSPVVGLAAVV